MRIIHDTEAAPLAPLRLHCVECDAIVKLKLETRFGVNADRRTLGVLCSDACAEKNRRRFTDDLTDVCQCGAAVQVTDKLLFESGRILGCLRCDWTGAQLRHYFPTTVGAPHTLCGATTERGKPLTSTTDRESVNCDRCVELLELATKRVIDAGVVS